MMLQSLALLVEGVLCGGFGLRRVCPASTGVAEEELGWGGSGCAPDRGMEEGGAEQGEHGALE